MKLFISYAHVDKPIIKDWIVDKLIAGSHEVWFDSHLRAGQDWRQQLSNAIEHSDAFVYCMTPEAIASEWCQWELAKAVELGKPVVPVLIQAGTVIPEPLSQLQYVDFSDGPTGDAVARLMGGLQQLSPPQIPSPPTNPQGIPPQAIKDGEKSGRTSRTIEIAGLVIAFISMVVAILPLIPKRDDVPVPSPTSVITLTETPSYTLTETSTPTNTVTETATLTDLPTATDIPTSTLTNTDTASHTPTNTYTAQPTNTQERTITPSPSLTHTVTPAPQATNTVTSQSINGHNPCTGIIVDSRSSQLNIVRAQPRDSAPLVRPVYPNEEVNVMDSQRSGGILWYQIKYRDFIGWVKQDDMINLSGNCP